MRDLHGNIPALNHIAHGKVADVNVLDEFLPEAGAFYGRDLGYIDFERLNRFTLEPAFFAVRAKTNVLLERRYAHLVDHSAGVHSDQTIILASLTSATAYPDVVRKVSFVGAETGKCPVFPANDFSLPAATIATLHKQRWQVELFFKWIKQHLRIKVFCGTSENAVKTQICIAVSVYVLVGLVRKRLELEARLYQIPQVPGLTLLENNPILRALQRIDSQHDLPCPANHEGQA